MAQQINRIAVDRDGQLSRIPDLFISHSSRDKVFARKLADDLTFCQVDVWFDEWELQPGDSLHDRIGHALDRSKYVGVVLADNFDDSTWARDELKQALARERRDQKVSVIPLVYGRPKIPPFLADKIYVSFGSDEHSDVDFYKGLFRLASMVHEVPNRAVDDAMQEFVYIDSVNMVIRALRYCGIEPYVKVGQEDYEVLKAAGGLERPDGKIRFNPEKVIASGLASPRLQTLMRRLSHEIWKR